MGSLYRASSSSSGDAFRGMAEEWENGEEGESPLARLRIKGQNAEQVPFLQAEEQQEYPVSEEPVVEIFHYPDDIRVEAREGIEEENEGQVPAEPAVEIIHYPDDIKVEARERIADLERIIQEQDTHDLYCPNCHSCITKRVILRKRKRITATEEEVSDDSPAEEDGDGSSEAQVFRCLACFSYFIPAGSGFRLFKKSARREEDDNLRDQGCLFSLYDLMTGRRNKRELGLHPSMDNRDVEASSSIIADNLKEEANPSSRVQLPPAESEIIPVPEEAEESREETRILVPREEPREEEEEAREMPRWDILKAIVYGGLHESVVGLGVISAAAGSSVRTATVVAMGLGALAGGLPVLVHNLTELRNEQSKSRYEQLLGDKSNFWLQAVLAVLCFVLVGASQSLIYGFSFRTSGLREEKLAAVAVASLAWVILLAAAKAHSQEHHQRRMKTYLLTILRYLGLAASACGISFFVGDAIQRLLPVFNDQTTPHASALTNGIALL